MQFEMGRKLYLAVYCYHGIQPDLLEFFFLAEFLEFEFGCVHDLTQHIG